jgi:hypothetical protein
MDCDGLRLPPCVRVDIDGRVSQSDPDNVMPDMGPMLHSRLFAAVHDYVKATAQLTWTSCR